MELITKEQLEALGYQLNSDFGVMEKDFGVGVESGGLAILIGNFPFDEPRVSIRVEGATIATAATTLAEIAELERLFGEAVVDLDHVMYVDPEDLDDESDETEDSEGNVYSRRDPSGSQ